jgi:hypothetical protein
MTLPYPHEVETGDLEPQKTPAHDPLDIERRVRNLVVVDEPYVDVAGRRVRSPPAKSARSVAAEVRNAMTRRFLERRPNADEATWQKFTTTLRAEMRRHTEMNEAALQQALLLIDGL